MNSVLREARQRYLQRLAEVCEERGTAIPDYLFSGGLWEAPNHRPLMEMVRVRCEKGHEPLPAAVRTLYDEDQEIRAIFDDYHNASPSLVWLTICLAQDAATLVPTLIYRFVETDDVRELVAAYPLDSPRALLEVDDNTSFGIAWPSVTSCFARIRQLAADGVIRDEWTRTAEFLKYHPLDRAYQENQKIRRLLMDTAKTSSQVTPHAE